MKTSRLFSLIPLLILMGILLSACVGSRTASSNSWPGLAVDSNQQTAYVAHGNFIYAVDTATGAEKWRYPEKADNKISFYAQPVLTSDGQLLAGSYNHSLYSLNPAANGKENWSFANATNTYVAGPAVSDQGIFAPNSDNNLYALGPDGKLRWQFKTQNSQWATPVIDGNIVYLPSMDHRLYAVDATTGQQIWVTDDLGGSVVGTPTFNADKTVVYIGTFANSLLAVDAKTGKVLNTFPTLAWVWSGPAYADGRLYFGDVYGNFYALNAADLTKIWQVQPDPKAKTSISGAPLVIGDTIYVGSESGTLYALDSANGSQRWSKAVGGKLYTTPIAVGDKILVAPNGIATLLVAMDLNGNIAWSYPPPKSN